MEQSKDLMSLKHQAVLIRNRIPLVNDLEVTEIADYIIQHGIMSPETINKIKAQITPQEQARQFLDQLARSGPKAFDVFKDSLRDGHPHLLKMILHEENVPAKLHETLNLVKTAAQIDVPDSTIVLLDKLKDWQEDLARYIVKTHGRVAQYPLSKKTVPIDSVFVPVSLRKASDEECSYLDDYHDIFDQNAENLDPKRILIKGRSGTGATTLLQKLAYDWAMQVTKESNDELMQKGLFGYEFLIPISLKNVEKGMTIPQIIAHKNPFITEEDAGHLCDYLETNPASVVFLIDGYDEYDLETSEEMTAMLSNEAHMKWCVVIATRPWKVSAIENPEFIDTQVEIMGFSRTGTEQFLRKYFQGEDDGDNILAEIERIATKQKLWDMMSSPVLAMFMCILGSRNKALPTTLTDLYFEILHFLIITQTNIAPEIQTMPKEAVFANFEKVLMEVGKVAFFGNITQSRSFNLSDTKEDMSEEAWKLGLLAGTDHEGEEEMAEFSCQSIQDFLAAYYFCKYEHEEVLMNTLKQRCNGLKAVYDMEYMFKFICGISPEKGNILLRHVDHLVKNSKYIKGDLSKPGPVQKSTIQASYFEYVNRISEFLVGCSMQFKQIDIDFPVTALSIDLTLESANLILGLLRNENNLTDLEMICLCCPVHKKSKISNQIADTKVVECLRLTSEKFHTLCLSNIDCSEGINELALEVTSKDNLKTLCLSKANLLPHHIKSMVKTFGLTCPGLRYLNMSGNIIQESVNDIANLLEYCPEMKGLSLSGTEMSSEHMKILSTAIETSCPAVESIDVSHNNADTEFKTMCAALQHLSNLKHLKARECNIPSSCFEDLATGLANCTSLQTLDLSWNPLQDDIDHVLSEKCLNFKCLKTLYMLALPISTSTLNSIEENVKCKLPNVKLHITQKLRTRNRSGVGLCEKSDEIGLRRANSQLDLQDMVPEAESESVPSDEESALIKRSISVFPTAKHTT